MERPAVIVSPLYVIVDAEVLRARGCRIRSFGQEMLDAGVRLLQYRNKSGTDQEILRDAAILGEVFAGSDTTLLLNDRTDLAVLAGWHGVHVGQTDLSPEDARRVVGRERLIGVSTHTPEQVRAADAGCADYLAIGPVFSTNTKADAEPVVGLDGVRQARTLTAKLLVAIGGITLENARSILDAGADAVAVISALAACRQAPGRIAGDFLALLR